MVRIVVIVAKLVSLEPVSDHVEVVLVVLQGLDELARVGGQRAQVGRLDQ